MKYVIETRKAFTLIELLMAVIILGFLLVGLMRVFVQCSVLAELARNKTVAMSEAQGKMEEIRNHDYASITTDYVSTGTPGNTFSLSQLNGMGIIYIDSGNADLLEIEIVLSWENKYNRVIGEDLDLDGVLDAGEDVNGNGQFDSVATLISLIANR